VTPEAFVAERIADLSTVAGNRVYMLKLPQKPTLPAVRVQLIDDVTEQHLRGPQPTTTRVQVDAFAADGVNAYATLRQLSDEIHGDGLGPMASGVFGFKGDYGSPAIRIQNVRLAFRGQPVFEGEEVNLLRIRQDYFVDWSAA
jgi:hypothetical protein